jgi:cysteine desulfurase family protein
MIYLDNAATTWPKPDNVRKDVADAIVNKGGNPGRSGHKPSISAGKILDRTRFSLAKLFNVDDMNRIVFTLNATDALNLAINGILKNGDHVITSSMEHNSVTRPLAHLKQNGVDAEKVFMHPIHGVNPADVKNSIRGNTKLVVMTHASNVTGTVNRISEIGELCQNAGIPFLVDASQSAGVLPIDVKKMGIDLLAFPGHKSLLGATGTGGLYIADGVTVEPSRYGGTGVYSEMPQQPQAMPFYYESGTQNVHGLAGLNAGLEFIMQKSVDAIHAKEAQLTERLISGFERIDKVIIYGPRGGAERAPVVSINIEGVDCADAAAALDTSFDIAVRAGLHCAPDAHKTIETFELGGTVRFSPGIFTTEAEIDTCINAVAEIAAEF